MEFLTFLIIAIVVGGLIQNAMVTSPGRQLHAKFVALGKVSGRTKDEIIAAVGQPTSISALPEGKTLLQWQATGCHMALRFNGDICECFTHQHLSQN